MRFFFFWQPWNWEVIKERDKSATFKNWFYFIYCLSLCIFLLHSTCVERTSQSSCEGTSQCMSLAPLSMFVCCNLTFYSKYYEPPSVQLRFKYRVIVWREKIFRQPPHPCCVHYYVSLMCEAWQSLILLSQLGLLETALF